MTMSVHVELECVQHYNNFPAKILKVSAITYAFKQRSLFQVLPSQVRCVVWLSPAAAVKLGVRVGL